MRDDQGYIVKACCENPDQGHRVSCATQVHHHPSLADMRDSLSRGVWPSECESCRVLESQGQHSQRTRARDLLEWTDSSGELHWNIRVDGTCNLACTQCNPVNSSRWIRDRDIYLKHTGDPLVERRSADLAWAVPLFERGGSITLLGGEPLASEGSLAVLESVSPSLRQGMDLIVTTNAVTLHARAVQALGGWRRVITNFSVDAVGPQFELLRWPGRWSRVLSVTRELQQLGCYPVFGVTVSALNWGALEQLIEWIGTRHYTLNLLTTPPQFQLHSLTPQQLAQHTIPQTQRFTRGVEYDPLEARRMRAYLQALDARRSTHSQSVLPWCWS